MEAIMKNKTLYRFLSTITWGLIRRVPRIMRLMDRKREMNLIDFSRLGLIREKSLDFLSDHRRLELDLLPHLGFNNERLHEFPEELYGYCGQGLLSWQYPNQFSKYLATLSRYQINTYLEIGVRHGGTFVATVEYLNRFHQLRKAVGVDICHSPSLVRYTKINPRAEFIQMDSQSLQFKEFIRINGRYDLVLIDGSHEENACRSDFENVRRKANIVVFHDIKSDICPGVGKVWNEVKAGHPDEYDFFEYVEQYKSVIKRTGHSFVGIGMAVRKDWQENAKVLQTPNLGSL
jgi:hypothetical protein